MASAVTFELRRAGGTRADPPTLTTVAPSWQAQTVRDDLRLKTRELDVVLADNLSARRVDENRDPLAKRNEER